MCVYIFDYIDGRILTITMVIESNRATNNLYRNRILFWQKTKCLFWCQNRFFFHRIASVYFSTEIFHLYYCLSMFYLCVVYLPCFSCFSATPFESSLQKYCDVISFWSNLIMNIFELCDLFVTILDSWFHENMKHS